MKSESLNNYKKQLPSWVNEDRGFALYLLQVTFPNLYATLELSEEKVWTSFNLSGECENQIPDSVREKISPFQTLMVIQTLRPDRLHTTMCNFARFALGTTAIRLFNILQLNVLLNCRFKHFYKQEENLYIPLQLTCDPCLKTL